MADMNVAITLDRNYLQHAAVMLRSLIATNKGHSIRVFAICDDAVRDEDWQRLAEVYQGSPLTVERVKVDALQDFSEFRTVPACDSG